jgi:WD40 repeat protein
MRLADRQETLLSDALPHSIQAMAFSPEGLLATLDANQIVTLWEPDTRLSIAIEEPNYATRNLAGWATVRDELVALEQSQGLTERHREESQLFLQECGFHLMHCSDIHGDEYTVLTSIAIDPTGRYLCVGTENSMDHFYSEGGSLLTFEIASGRCVQRTDDLYNAICNTRGRTETELIRWSPDGKRVAVNIALSSMATLDPFDGKSPHQQYHGLDGQDSPVRFDWCPDGEQLVVSLYRWDDGDHDSIGVLTDHSSERTWFAREKEEEGEGIEQIHTVRCSPDGTHMIVWGHQTSYVSCSTNGIDIYRVSDGERVHRLRGAWELSPHAHYVRNCETSEIFRVPGLESCCQANVDTRDAVWSMDDSLLALAGEGGWQIWDVEHGIQCATIPGARHIPRSDGYHSMVEEHAGAFARNKSWFAYYQNEHTVVVWDFDRGEQVQSIAVPEVQYGTFGMAFNEDDSVLVVWGYNALLFWDLEAKRPRNYVPFNPNEAKAPVYDGNPLLHKGGLYGRRSQASAAFALPAEEGHQWAVVFEEGLVVCPPALRSMLDAFACVQVGGRVAWPLRWLLACDEIDVVSTFEEALQSKRLPADFPGVLREHWAEGAKGDARKRKNRSPSFFGGLVKAGASVAVIANEETDPAPMVEMLAQRGLVVHKTIEKDCGAVVLALYGVFEEETEARSRGIPMMTFTMARNLLQKNQRVLSLSDESKRAYGPQ